MSEPVTGEVLPPVKAGQFQPGRSGNPAGRPKGARSLSARLIDEMVDEEALKAIIEKLVEQAKTGDPQSAHILLSRRWPVPKTRTISVDGLPELTTAGSIVAAQDRIMAAAVSGHLTPDEAESLSRVASAGLKALEVEVLDRRLRAIEAKLLEAK